MPGSLRGLSPHLWFREGGVQTWLFLCHEAGHYPLPCPPCMGFVSPTANNTKRWGSEPFRLGQVWAGEAGRVRTRCLCGVRVSVCVISHALQTAAEPVSSSCQLWGPHSVWADSLFNEIGKRQRETVGKQSPKSHPAPWDCAHCPLLLGSPKSRHCQLPLLHSRLAMSNLFSSWHT